MIELIPCPFCGSYETAIRSGNEGYWVSCDECGADGPAPIRLWDTEQKAIDAWNRRAEDDEST